MRVLGAGREGGGDGGLVGEEAMRKLRDTTELDYLTHVVFRMYENKRCAPLPCCCTLLPCKPAKKSYVLSVQCLLFRCMTNKRRRPAMVALGLSCGKCNLLLR